MDPIRMPFKRGDMVWRTFRDAKKFITHIPICINDINTNPMCNSARKTHKTPLTKTAVIVKFNDGIFFTR